MFKKISWVVALIAVFAMVFMGCPSESKYEEKPFEGWQTTGPITPTGWGSNSPTIADGWVSITAGSSTGFAIDLEALGYVYNRNDILVFTYEVDITTPEAVLTAKNGNSSSSWTDGTGGNDYGKGKGREYMLGNVTHSVYDGPRVAGTYTETTTGKGTGTFEVLMVDFQGLKIIGFQHNYWATYTGESAKVAENSVYKVKITKIENKQGETPPEEPPFEWPAEDLSGVATTYTVPASGADFFYVNLNDWHDGVMTAITDNPVTAALTASNVAVTFNGDDGTGISGQRVVFRLPNADAAKVLAAEAIRVEIVGTADPATTEFRYFIVDANKGNDYNSIGAVGQGTLASILDKTSTFNANRDTNPLTCKYFALQIRQDVSTVVTITSIKITLLDEAPDPNFIGGTGTKLIVTVDETPQDVTTITPVVSGVSGSPYEDPIKFFDNNTGYRTYSSGYGNAYAYFAVDFGSKKLNEFSAIEFSVQGVSGDNGYKSYGVWAGLTAPSGHIDLNAVGSGVLATGSYENDGKAKQDFSLSLSTADDSLTGTVNFVLNVHAGVAAWNISDIKFIPKGSVPEATDFTIGLTTPQKVGEAFTATTVVAKNASVSQGAPTIYYTGLNVDYPKSDTAPTAKGIYAVTFDVAVDGDWEAAEGLSAGILELVTTLETTTEEFELTDMVESADYDGSTLEADGLGFTAISTNAYGNYVKFSIDLGDYDISDLISVSFTWTGVSGDNRYKDIAFIVATSITSADQNDPRALGKVANGVDTNGTAQLTITFDPAKKAALTGSEFEVTFYVHAGALSFSITDIEFTVYGEDE